MGNYGVLLVVLLAVGLVMFLVHFLARRLAQDLAERTKDRDEPIVRPGFLLALALIFGACWVLAWGVMWWPPRWIERQRQRVEISKRIETAGGWNAVINDSKIFWSTNEPPYFRFFPNYQSNLTLPPAITALKPREITGETNNGLCTVKYQLFGYHSTGARGQAFYWLLVVINEPGTNTTELFRKGPGGQRTIHQVTNTVFEIY
jgi:hypothetical protein